MLIHTRNIPTLPLLMLMGHFMLFTCGAGMASAESVEKCGNEHKVSFFCSNCNRLFCGDCCSRTHKGVLKGHDWEEIGERLTVEEQLENQLVNEINQLSESAEAAAIAKDAIDEELRETLSGFVAQVERLVMCAQIIRDAKALHQLRSDCIALLQRDASARMFLDPKTDPVGALQSRLSMNARLEKQREDIRKVLENAAVIRETNVVEAIHRAAVALNAKRQENVKGLLMQTNLN